VRERKIDSVFVRVCERERFVLCQSVAIYVHVPSTQLCALEKKKNREFVCVWERDRKSWVLSICRNLRLWGVYTVVSKREREKERECVLCVFVWERKLFYVNL